MFKRILMPTDGSDFSMHAAEYAADIAARYSASVVILYVVELPPVLGIPPAEDVLAQTRQELSRVGTEALQKTRSIFENAGISPQEQIDAGSAVPDILMHAGDGEFDLVVIGSHGTGTGAINQILIGSVAEGVLHGSPCPVLMVRRRK